MSYNQTEWARAWKISVQKGQDLMHQNLGDPLQSTGRRLRDFENEDPRFLGQVILDLGCSPYPLTSFLRGTYKRILVDLVPQVHTLSSLPDQPKTVQLDLNELANTDVKTKGVSALEAAIMASSDGRIQGVNTIVASWIVSYLDAAVFTQLDRYLKPGGMVLISYAQDLGDPATMHQRRPKSEMELKLLFARMGYRVIELPIDSVVAEIQKTMPEGTPPLKDFVMDKPPIHP